MQIKVKLTPKASQNAVQGWFEDENGKKLLKVSVTAVPEKGKANKAMISVISKHFKVPKTSISLISGDTSRLKIIEIKDGDKTKNFS